jgi:hypothetical protein
MNIFPDTAGMALWYKLGAWLRWLRAWFRGPHNIVFLDIPPTWCDKDEKIRLFVFKMLKDFVEKEKCFEHIEYSTNDIDREVEKKIRATYAWITVDRKKAVAEYEQLLHKVYGHTRFEETPIPGKPDLVELHLVPKVSETDRKSVTAAETYYETRDQEVLLDIMTIRRHLWT